MDEHYDDDLVGACSIDKAVVSDEQLSVFTTPELWNPAATIRQGRERFRCFEKIGDESASS
jgi:hypothetical protein